jgi:macrolide transport system ATP-binding/permease protein
MRDYATALQTAEDLHVWDIDSRIEVLLDGLGLTALHRDRATQDLSGGQRSRLSLAWLLLSAPDVLLLDEPTNHLDDAATAHLRDVLAAWSGPVLLASHDRAFLDEAVTSLLDLDPSPVPHALAGDLVEDGSGTGIGLTRYTGTYTDYLQSRRDERARWERKYRDEQAELTRLRTAVDRNQTVGHADWKPRTESRIAQKFYGDRNATVVSRRAAASTSSPSTRSASPRRSCGSRASSPAGRTPQPRPPGHPLARRTQSTSLLQSASTPRPPRHPLERRPSRQVR